MTKERFFKLLLEQTKKQFELSPICRKQIELGKKWNYSICGTPIQTGRGILLGINWGADDSHEAQSKMPDGEDIAGYGFIRRSEQYLKKHLQLNLESLNFNYANLCFFRSPRESDLTDDDYKLSLPLFKQYVEFINPPWIFSLGSGNSNRLINTGELKSITEYPDKAGKFRGLSGTLWDVPYFSVPHPNARVKRISRDEIWESLATQFKF